MVASNKVVMHIRIKDLDRAKLLMYQLNELRSKMVIEASPYASELDKIIDRFLDGGDDDRPEDKEEPADHSPS